MCGASFYFLSTVCLLLVIQACTLVAGAPDSRGKEFIIGFLQNKKFGDTNKTDVEVVIAAATDKLTRVVVTTPLFDPTFKKIVIAHPGVAETVTIPHAIRGQDTEKAAKAVYLQADYEIAAFAINKETYSTDAYIALPLDVLGMEFYAVTYTDTPLLMIVGTENNTQVSITFPTSHAEIMVEYDNVIHREGSTLNIILNKFEIFHAKDGNFSADFTGTHILSDKPVAVLSGNLKVRVPVTTVHTSADHIVEMMMPVDTWGTHFLTTHTPHRKIGDLFRFVASQDNTQIVFHDGSIYNIAKAGHFVETDRYNDYQSVRADKPVMMAMISKTFNETGEHKGDPSMSLIIPVPQYASNYTWATVTLPNGQQFDNFVTVIIDRDQVAGLVLDDATPTWIDIQSISGSDKVHMWTDVSSGSHNLHHLNPIVTFLLMASGVERHHSYAYLAGLRLALINTNCSRTDTVPGDIVDNDCDGKVDEELENGIDDDDDGEIDEDLAVKQRTDKNETIYRCQVTGDPHLNTFSNHTASIALPCAFMVTSLQIRNTFRNPGVISYDKIRVDVEAGNSNTSSRGRYFVSIVIITVTFYDDSGPGPMSQYRTSEQLIDSGELWAGDLNDTDFVRLTYDSQERLAQLWLINSTLLVQFRPVNRSQGTDQELIPGVFVQVGEYDLIYNDSNRFPNTMCSTVNDTKSMHDYAVQYNVTDPHNMGIYAVMAQSPRQWYEDQDAMCFLAMNQYNMCNSTLKNYAFNTCVVMPRHGPLVNCFAKRITTDHPDVTAINAVVDCIQYRCFDDKASCYELMSYNRTCQHVAHALRLTHC